MAQTTWERRLAAVSVHDFISIHDDEDDELDFWHVQLAPGDVKVISLDRLDDLYRLSLIDDSTLLWQPGMRNWKSLSAVAGLEALPKPLPPPRPVLPPPPQPLGSFGLVSPARPLPVAKPIPELVPQSRVDAPATLRPVSMSDAPAAASSGGFGRTLVALALLSGLAVTLYRNDALRGAARSMGQEPTYARLEQALGGPGFGTLRSVDQFSKGAATLSLVAMAPAKSTESVSTVVKPPAASVALEPKAVALEPKAVALDSLPTEKPAPSSVEPSVRRKPVAAKAADAAGIFKAPARKSRRSRSSSSDYDPLNPKL